MGALLASPALSANDGILLEMQRIETGVWTAEGVRVALEQDGPLELLIAEFRLPAPFAPLHDVEIRCPALELLADGVRCRGGRLRFDLGSERLSAPFDLVLSREEISFELPDAELHGLHFGASAHGKADDWKAELRVGSQSIGEALVWVDDEWALPGYSISEGTLSLALRFSGGPRLEEIRVDVEVTDLAFSDESGLRAGEGLGFSGGGELRRIASEWEVAIEAALRSGAVNVDSIFVQVFDPPPAMDLRAVFEPASRRVRVRRLTIDHPGVFTLRGEGSVSLGHGIPIESFVLELPPTAIEPLYRTYLRNLAPQDAFRDLETGGRVGVLASWTNGAIAAVRLDLREVDIDDRRGRFAGYGVTGVVHWQESGLPPRTEVGWRRASLYALPLGEGALQGRLAGRSFSLDQAVSVSLLEGRLDVERFEASGIGTPGFEWRMDGRLEPVSIAALGHAFGWPPFGGALESTLPDLHYRDGVIAVAGELVMGVFDGEVRMRDVVLEQPFSSIPVLRANVDIAGLALRPLTSAFSFGNIEGRIDGRVHDLILQDWRPLSFDAEFQTSPGDSSDHRISQTAVDNLAGLGGGGTNVLSSTFLRFFDEFSYERLGIRCRLRNGVCEMGGVEPAEHGYYIVKGGGLPPRIDVLGFNQRVDWETLIERLANISNPDGPIIQ